MRSAGTSASGFPTSRPLYSPSSAFGLTPTSIENVEALALARQLVHVELGVADGDDARGDDRLLVPLGKRVADRLLDDGLAAEPLDDHLRRHLALAKAGHLHLAGQLLCGAVHPLFDHVGLDGYVQAHARFGQLGQLGLHRRRAYSGLRLSPMRRRAQPPSAAPRSPRNATTRPTGPVKSQARNRSPTLSCRPRNPGSSGRSATRRARGRPSRPRRRRGARRSATPPVAPRFATSTGRFSRALADRVGGELALACDQQRVGRLDRIAHDVREGLGHRAAEHLLRGRRSPPGWPAFTTTTPPGARRSRTS